MNQADLGKAVGVSREIIGRYERNEVLPSVEVAAKIAKALEVSLDYLAIPTSSWKKISSNASQIYNNSPQMIKRIYSPSWVRS